MTVQRDPTVDELRRDSERTRAALTGSVVQLREKVSDTADDLKVRLSPSHIKEEVKDYVREGSERFIHSIERKARENPLQAIAIGAGLAYPLFKSVPVPLMLIGAGLWLSKQKTASGNGYGQGLAGTISEAGTEGVSRFTESAREAGESVTDKVRATFHDVRESAANLGQAAVDGVTGAAADATNTVTDAAIDMMDRATHLSSQTRNALEDLVERNPLLVGGVGLAIGAVIAASLPSSNTEDRMFGARSDELKDKALEAASQGVDRAEVIAAAMADDAQGLATDVQGVTEGVKAVVDKGLKTALGEETSFPTPSNRIQSSKLTNGGQND